MIVILKFLIPWVIIGIISIIIIRKYQKEIVKLEDILIGFLVGPLISVSGIIALIVTLFIKWNKKPLFDFSENPEEHEKEMIRESIKELKKYFKKYPELFDTFLNFCEKNKKIFTLLNNINKNKK